MKYNKSSVPEDQQINSNGLAVDRNESSKNLLSPIVSLFDKLYSAFFQKPMDTMRVTEKYVVLNHKYLRNRQTRLEQLLQGLMKSHERQEELLEKLQQHDTQEHLQDCWRRQLQLHEDNKQLLEDLLEKQTIIILFKGFSRHFKVPNKQKWEPIKQRQQQNYILKQMQVCMLRQNKELMSLQEYILELSKHQFYSNQQEKNWLKDLKEHYKQEEHQLEQLQQKMDQLQLQQQENLQLLKQRKFLILELKKQLKQRVQQRKRRFSLVYLCLIPFIIGSLIGFFFIPQDFWFNKSNKVVTKVNEKSLIDVRFPKVIVGPTNTIKSFTESEDSTLTMIKSDFHESVIEFSSAFKQPVPSRNEMDYYSGVVDRLFPKVIDIMSRITDRFEEQYPNDENVLELSADVIDLYNLRLDLSNKLKEESDSLGLFYNFHNEVLSICSKFHVTSISTVLNNNHTYLFGIGG